MKIQFYDNYVKIKLTESENEYTFGGQWDILQLKNSLLKSVEDSFNKEVAALLTAGTFSKYKDLK